MGTGIRDLEPGFLKSSTICLIPRGSKRKKPPRILPGMARRHGLTSGRAAGSIAISVPPRRDTKARRSSSSRDIWTLSGKDAENRDRLRDGSHSGLC